MARGQIDMRRGPQATLMEYPANTSGYGQVQVRRGGAPLMSFMPEVS
jgi:hypothetical protein